MKRATLKVATMPHADNFQLHLFADLAQQEREFIAGRTKDALAALKREADSGKTEAMKKVANRAFTLTRGRTDHNRAKARQAVQDRVSSWTETLRDPIDLCIRKGATTLTAVAECMNSKNITTSRGGTWSPMQVRRVMLSLGLSFGLP